jgi:hypothetical protein
VLRCLSRDLEMVVQYSSTVIVTCPSSPFIAALRQRRTPARRNTRARTPACAEAERQHRSLAATFHLTRRVVGAW